MKKLIILIFMSLFINNFSFANDKCSNYKKLSKNYLKCLGGKIKNKTSNLPFIISPFSLIDICPEI